MKELIEEILARSLESAVLQMNLTEPTESEKQPAEELEETQKEVNESAIELQQLIELEQNQLNLTVNDEDIDSSKPRSETETTQRETHEESYNADSEDLNEEEPLVRDTQWYADLARTFRGSIQRSTVMAFGMKNMLVFTGHSALVHLQNILRMQEIGADLVTTNGDGSEYRSTPTPSENTDAIWSRDSALEILQILVNDFWLFVPCGIQQRKGWTLKSGAKLSDTESHMCRTSITVFDDNRNLYRLTKDALVMSDISAECFDDFVQWLSNEKCGISRKSGRLGFRRITERDGVFSWATLSDWLETCLGVYAAKEKDAIKKLLISRRIMEKLPLYSCYQFTSIVLHHQKDDIAEEKLDPVVL